MELDRKTGETVWKVKFTKPLPYSLRGIAFDAAGNLRSSLDRAGFAVAVAAGTKGGKAHFPFGGNLGDVHAKAKGGSRDIPKEVFDAMVACKPYKGGNDTLWAINRLCNTSKHEILVPLGAESGGFTMQPTVMKGPLSITNRWDSSKNELEVARLSKGAAMQGDFGFKFLIALGDIGRITGAAKGNKPLHLTKNLRLANPGFENAA
jgi:hypothetical protein